MNGNIKLDYYVQQVPRILQYNFDDKNFYTDDRNLISVDTFPCTF